GRDSCICRFTICCMALGFGTATLTGTWTVNAFLFGSTLSSLPVISPAAIILSAASFLSAGNLAGSPFLSSAWSGTATASPHKLASTRMRRMTQQPSRAGKWFLSVSAHCNLAGVPLQMEKPPAARYSAGHDNPPASPRDGHWQLGLSRLVCEV